ncbi:unnamed protein product [Rangifer tarandus platyrhynchus]|uniref:Uncharacterized protein n=1 Tax=Rangifer tarandus platyrhynchus TaxID=3082113 RepID=A0ABN8Y852_RANTA|nr:unnamed protein product [Rangifer tarandus platyrhynchus]
MASQAGWGPFLPRSSCLSCSFASSGLSALVPVSPYLGSAEPVGRGFEVAVRCPWTLAVCASNASRSPGSPRGPLMKNKTKQEPSGPTTRLRAAHYLTDGHSREPGRREPGRGWTGRENPLWPSVDGPLRRDQCRDPCSTCSACGKGRREPHTVPREEVPPRHQIPATGKRVCGSRRAGVWAEFRRVRGGPDDARVMEPLRLFPLPVQPEVHPAESWSPAGVDIPTLTVSRLTHIDAVLSTSQKAAHPPTLQGRLLTPLGQAQPGVVPDPAAVVPAETGQRPARPIDSLRPARGPGSALQHPGQAAIFSVLDHFYFSEGESGSSLRRDAAELAESASNTGSVENDPQLMCHFLKRCISLREAESPEARPDHELRRGGSDQFAGVLFGGLDLRGRLECLGSVLRRRGPGGVSGDAARLCSAAGPRRRGAAAGGKPCQALAPTRWRLSLRHNVTANISRGLQARRGDHGRPGSTPLRVSRPSRTRLALEPCSGQLGLHVPGRLSSAGISRCPGLQEPAAPRLPLPLEVPLSPYRLAPDGVDPRRNRPGTLFIESAAWVPALRRVSVQKRRRAWTPLRGRALLAPGPRARLSPLQGWAPGGPLAPKSERGNLLMEAGGVLGWGRMWAGETPARRWPHHPGNRDIGKRTVVLCVTCTSKRRRSCGPCLCGPLKRVAAEPIAETPGGLQSVSEPLSLASAPLRVLAVPLLPGWSWRPCGWNRAHWIQRSRRNTDGHSGRAVSIWVPALSPSCSVPTRERPKAASLSAVQLWAFCPRVKPPAAQHTVQPTPS